MPSLLSPSSPSSSYAEEGDLPVDAIQSMDSAIHASLAVAARAREELGAIMKLRDDAIRLITLTSAELERKRGEVDALAELIRTKELEVESHNVRAMEVSRVMEENERTAERVRQERKAFLAILEEVFPSSAPPPPSSSLSPAPGSLSRVKRPKAELLGEEVTAAEARDDSEYDSLDHAFYTRKLSHQFDENGHEVMSSPLGMILDAECINRTMARMLKHVEHARKHSRTPVEDIRAKYSFARARQSVEVDWDDARERITVSKPIERHTCSVCFHLLPVDRAFVRTCPRHYAHVCCILMFDAYMRKEPKALECPGKWTSAKGACSKSASSSF